MGGVTLCLRLRCSSPASMPRGVEQLLKPPKDPDTLPSCMPHIKISGVDSGGRRKLCPEHCECTHKPTEHGQECPSPESYA